MKMGEPRCFKSFWEEKPKGRSYGNDHFRGFSLGNVPLGSSEADTHRLRIGDLLPLL